MKLNSNVLTAALFLLAATSAAQAQSSLNFRGSSLSPIPLDVSQPLTVADDGSVQATCLFQAGTTVCQGVSPPVSAQIPAVTLTAPGLTADGQGRFQVAAGTEFSIVRSVTNSPDVCLTSSSVPNSTTGWSNSFAPAASTTASVRLNVAGEYTLGLRCYNVAGAAAQPTQIRFIVSAPVGPNPGACTLRDDLGITHPLLQPTDFTGFVRTWPQVFNGFTFPNTPSSAMPVGSYSVTLNQGTAPPSAGMYLAIPITLAANSRLNILTTYPIGGFPASYVLPRPGNVFVSLSPCAGDLRPQSSSAPDIFGRQCRGVLGESTINFFTFAGAGCSVPPGDYWINIMHADPSVPGFNNTFETCFPLEENNPTARCESNFSMEYTVL